MTPSVVIVSNRLPISIKKSADGSLAFYPSVGGLATGLAAYVDDKRNKWIGWPGIPSDDLTKAEREEITTTLRKSNCYPVFLTQKQLDNFYNGYSNTILWPIFHDLPAHTEAHDRYWKAYKSVNSAFAGVVLALSDTRSTIWVHDYQLLILPALLRVVRPKAKIGFFLHIPFPSLKHFQKVPSAKHLLAGTLGADLMGLHTKSYADNYLEACKELTSEIVESGQVIQGVHTTRVMDFPMGIDYDRFTRARKLSAVKKELRQHKRKYKGLKVILTVDRLDPTKGLVERLEAYYEFLRRTPTIHGKVIMVMLAVPSRTEIDEYIQLRERVEDLVARISKEFGTKSWQPVDYMYTSMSVEAVTALYQVADVAFITPLRDGMNLVAKEYIASRPKHDGVLILSSTAGAAQELTDALLVNPRRPESLVQALTSAVKMPKRELKHRISTMHKQIATHTVQHWAGNFMQSLQKPIPGTRHITRTLTQERQEDLFETFSRAQRPLLLLDYDGVLAPHVTNPAKAAPTTSILRTLNKLSQTEKVDIAIISGRSQQDLELWLGDLPISLVAEHGALLRPSKTTKSTKSSKPAAKKAAHAKWQRLTDASPAWQDAVLPILEKYAANTPGAFVEAKNFSLVWHYRAASPYYAQKHLVILRRLLRPYAKSHGLGVFNGNKILEIKPTDVNKGSAVTHLLDQYPAAKIPDFILCMGDDYTDEDMFDSLPLTAYTIKVGRGRSIARYRVQTTDDVYALLKRLSA
ncbi:MAG TPA: bifunctional alpha,alpha-trehalose-phosphate synthase (UDP-forming)/trehalose-phosphatase [Candidatus Saccharimonadales bacterium]|jgi:trehalose 6-phosphate synthase/phosphatase